MRLRTMIAALAASAVLPIAGAQATDLEVTHWWTSGGEAAAVAEFAKAFDNDGAGDHWVDGAIACGTRSGEVMLFDFLPPRLVAAVSWHRERPLIASLDSEGVLVLAEWHSGSVFLEPLGRRSLVPGAWLGTAASPPEVAWSSCGRALRITCGERTVVVDATTLETTSAPGSTWLPPLRTSPDGAWRVEPGGADVRPLPRTS